MALKCRIDQGLVKAPNGSLSMLYTELRNKYGSDKAMELYALTETPEYKDILGLDVDINGEMYVESFLRFAYMQEEPMDVTKEATDLLHKISSEDLGKLQGLYIAGIFQPTRENLKATGIFSEDEILDILYSYEKRDMLKSLVDTGEDLPNVSQVEDFIAEKQVYNGIGIKPLRNPQEVKEDVVRRLSGVNPEDIDAAVESLPYPRLVERYKNDPEFKVSLIKSLNHSYIVPIEHDPVNTIEELLNVVDVTLFGDITETTDRISELDYKDLIIEEFDVLRSGLIQAGVDIQFDEDYLYGKTIDELKEFSYTLQNFVFAPSMETTAAFASVVDKFRSRDTDKVITDFFNPVVKSSTLRYFDTNKNEVQAFEQNSLIKHKEGVYQKIDNKYGLDELYEYLYAQVLSNPSLIGMDNIPSAEGRVDVLRDEINKGVVMQDIRDYVTRKANSLPFADTETQQTIGVYKLFYGAPFEANEVTEVVEPIDNEDYLKSDFVNEFNFYKIISSREDTEFFDLFKVDHKGIRLVYQNQFSIDNALAKAPPGLKKDLINYSKLSKYLDLGVDTINDTVTDTVIRERLNAQQNPQTITETKKSYQVAERDEVISEETRDFIRIRDRVYERALTYKDKSIYKELPSNDTLYKQTNIQKPMTGKSADYLKTFMATKANTVQYKADLTQAELAEINQKHFACA